MRRFILVLVLCLGCTSFAMAEESVKKIMDSPAKVSGRSTSVWIEHAGADTVGGKLAFRVKELCNSSSLFVLTQKDTPKLTLLMTSLSEFPSRPEIGSAVSVVWVYSESEGTLKSYLGRDVLLVSDNNVQAVAQRLAERTDGMAVKYSYLFEK